MNTKGLILSLPGVKITKTMINIKGMTMKKFQLLEKEKKNSQVIQKIKEKGRKTLAKSFNLTLLQQNQMI